MKKWFAVIGDPIKHSKSPEMHHFWYEDMQEDAAYVPIHVTPDTLAQAVESMKLLGASGWNVTIPHKETILPLLDALDEQAAKMGAVNTVVRQPDGTLKGYNTDGLGFVRSLEEAIGDTQKSARLLIIGAGGAARGIAFALQASGYTTITIANRTVEKAAAIVEEMQAGEAISLQQAGEQLAQFDILVQTTSAGLSDDFSMPFPLTHLREGAIVADIVYNPLITPFLQAAQQQGARIVTGVGMFVHQGAIAYEHWLHKTPNTNAMIARLTTQLGGN
ncbi:MAG: shikimate dehydrogenase [Caryophanon sp.]|nr:shikimate dehydrogenase [Caryophanon sp.]